jgi:hypothetical protein
LLHYLSGSEIIAYKKEHFAIKTYLDVKLFSRRNATKPPDGSLSARFTVIYFIIEASSFWRPKKITRSILDARLYYCMIHAV